LGHIGSGGYGSRLKAGTTWKRHTRFIVTEIFGPFLMV